MAQFGWAYINVTASSGTATIAGPTGSVLLLHGDSAASGSANFTYVSGSNSLFLTGAIYVSGAVVATGFEGAGSGVTGVYKTAYNSFSSSFDVSASYDVVGVNSSGSVITASLPLASSTEQGKRFTIKDITGSAGTNNIAVEPTGSDAVDGSTSGVAIAVDYGSVTVMSDGVGAYYIVGLKS